MKKLIVYTPSTHYIIHENGNIERTDMNHEPSGEWKLIAIQHVKRREFYRLDELTPELIKSLTMRYKNGNPQYTGVDYDHGSLRTWGNTRYHGITCIEFAEPQPERNYWNDLIAVRDRRPEFAEMATKYLNQLNTAGGKEILRNDLESFFHRVYSTRKQSSF